MTLTTRLRRTARNRKRSFGRLRIDQGTTAAATPAASPADIAKSDHLRLAAIAAYQQGDLETASSRLYEAIAVRPDGVGGLHDLAVVQMAMNQSVLAEATARRAVNLDGSFVEAYLDLGNALNAQGRSTEAMHAFRRALVLRPTFVEAMNGLSISLRAMQQSEDAASVLDDAATLNPQFAPTFNNLGLAQLELGRPEDAEVSFLRALEIAPSLAEAESNLGVALQAQQRYSAAEEAFRRSIVTAPHVAQTHFNLANTLQMLNRFDEAVDALQEAIDICPGSARVHNNLGVVYQQQGLADQARQEFVTALRLDANLAQAHSNLLLTQQYAVGTTPRGLLESHKDWDRRFGFSAPRQFEKVKRQPRLLRIGFVSPDFGFHPVAHLFASTLSALLDHPCVTYCYSDRSVGDQLTDVLSQSANEWRETHRHSDRELAELIRGDEIDVLFDLSGHTAGNRLQMFARRVSPIQIGWIGYPGTSGLTNVDYLLADRYHIPDGTEDAYTESILRMPNGYVCFAPPTEAPGIGSLPVADTGRITFGSFSNPLKINTMVVAVWADILQQVPNSRLLLRYRGMNDGTTRNRLEMAFANTGITSSRLVFEEGGDRGEMLEAYNRVDIGLDPLTYSGGVTTCEALWMGVPVVTCPGATFASRHSLSHLSNAGLTDTIAADFTEYSRLAIELAQDENRLANYRYTLRQQVQESPLCDSQTFAAQFLNVLHCVNDRG